MTTILVRAARPDEHANWYPLWRGYQAFYKVDIDRPRDVAEIKTSPRFVELHAAIWAVLREEVLKGYQQQLAA